MTHRTSLLLPLLIVLLLVSLSISGLFVGGGRNSAGVVENQLSIYPNIETAGIALSGMGLPQNAQLQYRRSGEVNWQEGHPLVRIDDGRLIGSLFGLTESTAYEVKVLVGTTEFAGSFTTQVEALQFTPTTVLHVNDDATAGGDGSAAAPFKTIQEGIDHAGPGTQVLVADGTYRESLVFPASGSANQWIQVKAEGSAAILDGSEALTGDIWKPHPTRGRVWFLETRSPMTYLGRDGKRFYRYDDLSGLIQTRGHGNVTINEGWYYDPNSFRLYIRSADDPSRHTWQMPRRNYAFDINARDWIWIEGFEMQFYGASTSGCGVCTLNASHIVIRNNRIHNMQLGVYVNWNGGENQGNDTRIEYNEIYDPLVNEFPWQAVKGSSMEGTGIVVRGHIGAIVRGNDIHNFFNGIYTGSSGALENPGVAFDVDVYNNSIHQISDDALEPEGAAVNHRFRSNIIHSSFVGVSLAPITQGPTWVLRSVISSYTSTSIKWALNSDGVVYIYHNTSWTNASNANAMHLITPVRNSLMRNNIFQTNAYSIVEVATGSLNNDWNYDNWYTTRASSGPHFKWENINYNTISALCRASGLECNGYEDPPGFANPQAGNFTLTASSPNIDRAILIPGINDAFAGSAPDVGAYEYVFDPAPAVISIARADDNPTSAERVRFTVTFSEEVTGLDAAPPFPDFKLVADAGLVGASIAGVTPVSAEIYTVEVTTGSGSGSLRLDLVDDDSILDARGQPLGGAGPGNGGFTSGETYTVDRGTVNTVALNFKSAGAYDGWILESGENTNAGGTLDKNATTFNIGDDQRDRQYRSVVSFDTSSIPDQAVIVSVQLQIKRQGIVGTDPFATHGSLFAEIRNGPFGAGTALLAADFSAAASPGAVRDTFAPLTFTWYAAPLSTTNLSLVNKAGVTQFRLLFSKDDNDDLGTDTIKFFSGDSVDANRPQLIVTYYLP